MDGLEGEVGVGGWIRPALGLPALDGKDWLAKTAEDRVAGLLAVDMRLGKMESMNRMAC